MPLWIVIRVRLCREVERWALGFGEQCEIVRPAALRRELGRRLRVAAGRYAASGKSAKTKGSGRGKTSS